MNVRERLKTIFFVFGLGVMCGYYGLTCLTFILAFLTQSTSVIIHLNIFHELPLEFVLTVLSIPCAIYVLRDIRENM